jgi:Ca2+-binding RTX toxin-like protein
LVLAAAVALALLAPPAHAAQVDALADVVYTAAAAEANALSVSSDDGLRFTLEDAAAPLTAGGGCTQSGEHRAVCTLPLGSHPMLRVDLRDRDDSADLSGVGVAAGVAVSGGSGHDVLTGGGAAVALAGDDGDDVLIGGHAADRLDGGADADLLDGREGPDVLAGGTGIDTIDYSRRTEPVSADLGSGRADSGAAGEADTLDGAEILKGGGGGDTLLGGAGSNVLAGGPGDDRLDGRAGADRLVGGPGRDSADYSSRSEPLRLALRDAPVWGGASDGPEGARDRIDATVERLVGGSGADVLSGDGGDNVLDGGPGGDLFIGGDGEDAADYTNRDEPLVLRVDGQPDSGSARDGAGDTIRSDVEDLWGGTGADALTGDGGDNLLDGGPGADLLRGGAGEDAADYSERASPVVAALDGTPGSGGEEDGPPGARDTLATDIEDLFGGAGADTLTGNSSRNFVAGQAGDDLIDLRGSGGDYADCGGGYDRAWVAPDDIPGSNCERIGAGPDETTSTGGSDRLRPQVRISLVRGQRLATVRRAGLVIHFTCSETCRLDARLLVGRADARELGLRLRRGSLLAARAPAQRDGPGQGTFTLKPSALVAKRLKQTRKADFALIVKGRDAAGNLTRVDRHVQLLPAKARLGRRR